MYWHVLWSLHYLTALRCQDIIVRMPVCVVSKYLVPGSTEDCPCVSECDTDHVGDNRGAEPYVEHWLCRLSNSTGRLTRFSKFNELLITAQRYAHKSSLGSLKGRGKRFTVRDMVGKRKRQSSTLCWSPPISGQQITWHLRWRGRGASGASQPSLSDFWLVWIRHKFLGDSPSQSDAE